MLLVLADLTDNFVPAVPKAGKVCLAQSFPTQAAKFCHHLSLNKLPYAQTKANRSTKDLDRREKELDKREKAIAAREAKLANSRGAIQGTDISVSLHKALCRAMLPTSAVTARLKPCITQHVT